MQHAGTLLLTTSSILTAPVAAEEPTVKLVLAALP